MFIERHWVEGIRHGIERHWDETGSLDKGWPKYWVSGVEVTESKYVQAAQKDPRLPIVSEIDHDPKRNFPPEIQILIDCR